MKTILIAMILSIGSLLSAQNAVLFNKGVITISRSESGPIQIDASRLRQYLVAGYTIESIKGGPDKLFVVCEISTYPTMTDDNGKYYSLTFHKSEFSPRDTKDSLEEAGGLAFWGEMKRVGKSIEFVVRKLNGVEKIHGEMIIRVNQLEGLPVITN